MPLSSEPPVVPPVQVVHADAPEAVVEFVAARLREACARVAPPGHKELAEEVKRALEGAFAGLWHVVVGPAFGLSVSHENNALLLLRTGPTHVLCFESLDAASLLKGRGAEPGGASSAAATAAAAAAAPAVQHEAAAAAGGSEPPAKRDEDDDA
jgi:hypothetical protein